MKESWSILGEYPEKVHQLAIFNEELKKGNGYKGEAQIFVCSFVFTLKTYFQ